ncbi:unnamed protein product [Brassica oleracea var. botrytis]
MVSAHIFDLKSVRVSQTVVTRLQRLWEARKGGELMELHMLLLDDKVDVFKYNQTEFTMYSKQLKTISNDDKKMQRKRCSHHET